jgi:hypothetical protein
VITESGLLAATWGTVAGVPGMGLYKLSRHWSRIRYTQIKVKDSSDVYHWIETYMSGKAGEEVRKQTTQLDLKLGSESGKDDGDHPTHMQAAVA